MGYAVGVSARVRSLRSCVRVCTTHSATPHTYACVAWRGAVCWLFRAIQLRHRVRDTYAHTQSMYKRVIRLCVRARDAIAMESSSVAGFLVASYARVVRLGMQRARRTYTEPCAVVERPFEGQGSRLRRRYIYATRPLPLLPLPYSRRPRRAPRLPLRVISRARERASERAYVRA